DGAATSFSGNLCSGYTIHSVMVVITVNPKIFGGIGGTEEVLPHVEIFTVPLQSPTTRLGSSVSSSKMVGRQKRSSVACTGCSRRLEKSKTSLQCNRCVSPNVTGVIRYRIIILTRRTIQKYQQTSPLHALLPDYGYENAVFVVSDTEMTKQTKKDAATMALEEMWLSTHIQRLQAAAKHHRCTTNRNNHQHLATSHVMHTRKKWTVRQQNHQALETMRTPASAWNVDGNLHIGKKALFHFVHEYIFR
ncbi:LOW QUALITY PROTEIN: hypothetical protein HID58_005294, partial [Brassica napus]